MHMFSPPCLLPVVPVFLPWKLILRYKRYKEKHEEHQSILRFAYMKCKFGRDEKIIHDMALNVDASNIGPIPRKVASIDTGKKHMNEID